MAAFERKAVMCGSDCQSRMLFVNSNKRRGVPMGHCKADWPMPEMGYGWTAMQLIIKIRSPRKERQLSKFLLTLGINPFLC